MEMRWKLISLSAALITVTSAQVLTVDNIVIVQSEKGTSNNEYQNNTLSDVVGNDDSSYNSNKKDERPQTDARDATANFNENEINRFHVIIPNLSDTKPISSRKNSRSKNTNGETAEKLPSSENGSSQKRSTEETLDTPGSNERETNENPEINEPVSSGQGNSVSGEVVSKEKSASEESSNVHPPIDVSDEGDGTSGQKSAAEDSEEQVVQTTHGPVKGYRWSDNTEIMAFYDIPYGKFSKPFETPVTAQSWIDVHDATEHTKVCPQLENDEYIGDTNCLTLTIFTPKDADNASVLFHVYDGCANCTSADPLMYGPDYLVPKGVILVLPNYRIGPLGFLCMQNETALGNAGLKDLSLALEWVKDNVHLFGGNPSNIAVSGNGAAGAYAGYLAICSRSRYYVNKVITESGSALSHWALDRNPMSTASKLAEKIRVDHSDGITFNNTFAEASLDVILKAAKGMRFKPCIEHDQEPFMDDTPWKILQSKEIDTTFMIGSATYAGTHEATDNTADFVAQINENFELLLPEDLVFKNDNERNEFAQKLRKQYFGEDNITVSDIEELSLWYTDASYLGPGIRLARPLLSAGATVYLYEFAFVGSLNRELEALHNPVPGAVRGDLTGYVFRKDGTSVDGDSSEKHMIELMVDLWVSFINRGKPAAANVDWNELEKAEDEEEEWLLISSEPKLKKGMHVDRLRLWTSLYDQYFIENNSGLRYNPHYLALAVALMCVMANNKLNYNNQ